MLSETPASLDLFSTSQTSFDLYERQSRRIRDAKLARCTYNAPYFAYQIKLAHYGVSQGCCNHWDCPRCGAIRAKEEYGRMVTGIESIAQTDPLYMLTITCRGKEITSEYADANYGEWTNRFLTSFRTRVKRASGKWCYVAVTERQTRGHPHSHILTTANPGDLHNETVLKCWTTGKKKGQSEYITVLRSDWLQNAVVGAGLGEQYDISLVRSAQGASRYAAKYLFKDTMFKGDWPKGWKRIRYSNNFPKLPEIKTDAFPLIDFRDWRLLSRRSAFVTVTDPLILNDVRHHLSHGDTIVQLK